MIVWGKRILGWAVVALILAGAWWFLFRSHAKTEEHTGERGIAVVPVTVAPAAYHSVERFVSVVGTLEGIEEVVLTPKVEGRVRAVLHDVDAVLAPNTPLLVLDDVDLKLAEAEAQRAFELELSRVGLSADKLPARGPEEDAVVVGLPLVVRARGLEENAGRRLRRVESLGTAVTAEEVEQARTDQRVAQSNLQQQILESRWALAAAREKLAKLHSAQQRLRDATLRVPTPSPERLAEIARGRGVPAVAAEDVRYRLAERRISEGEMVRAGSAGVFKLVLDQPLKLIVTVPDRYLGEVRVGQPVALEVEAYPGEPSIGTVVRLSPTVDRASRTFVAEVVVPNEDRRLRAGMFAKARIRTRQEDRALVVPEEALVSFAGVDKVFVVRGDKVLGVPVRLGERIEEAGDDRRQAWLEIRGAIEEGESVATSGQTQLADHTPVRIRTAGKGGR